MTEYDEHLIDDPSRFLKCPTCHRTAAVPTELPLTLARNACQQTTTTKLSIHLDGDVSIECEACGATAIANPLNTQNRTYE